MGYAQEEFPTTEKSLLAYIRENDSFPSGDVLRHMNLSLESVSKFVVDNEGVLLEKGLVDETVVAQAKKALDRKQ